MCVCGHDIRDHEDWDRDIHECNYIDCGCKQFRDADEVTPPSNSGEVAI